MLKQRCKFFESETIKRLSREIVLFLRTWEIEGMIVGIPPLVLRLRRKQEKVKARPREQACGGPEDREGCVADICAPSRTVMAPR